MDGLSWVLVASIIVWLAIFGFLSFLQVRLRKVQSKVNGFKENVHFSIDKNEVKTKT